MMYLNRYRCPRCARIWLDEWDCQPDDDCPYCGCRHVSPYQSDEIPQETPVTDTAVTEMTIADFAKDPPVRAGTFCDIAQGLLLEDYADREQAVRLVPTPGGPWSRLSVAPDGSEVTAVFAVPGQAAVRLRVRAAPGTRLTVDQTVVDGETGVEAEGSDT